MKLLTNRDQQRAYTRIVDVITTLAAEDTRRNSDAIGDMWQIAEIVGGRPMVDALEGRNYHTRSVFDKIGHSLSDGVSALDKVMGDE